MPEPPQPVAVVVPAAGQGTRLGGHRKQFRVLGGKSVLVQTLLVFERHPGVGCIVVATPREAVEPLKGELKRVGISKLLDVVAGGDSRQETVAAGLAALPADVEFVLIHDAVRPFVRLSSVTSIIDVVRKDGAASLAIPIVDTLRRTVDREDDKPIFGETVPRDNLLCMQTPQGFRVDWIREAHANAVDGPDPATDDVELVQRLGHPVTMVDGCPNNVKITTRADWDRAIRFWNQWVEIRSQEERNQIVGEETR